MMRISDQPPIDLTYCLNVHPGETWEQQFEALCENTLAIRDQVTASRASRRFGLGLRLSALSAHQLLGERGLAPFAGTARRVRSTNGACPLSPTDTISKSKEACPLSPSDTISKSKEASPSFPARENIKKEAKKKPEQKGTGTFCRSEEKSQATSSLGKTSQSPFSLERFKEFLTEQEMYVFTVNGFPYGQFHQTIVKDRVYKPDWTQPARRRYTETIARVLVELLDEGETASISTAPLTFKGWPDWQQSIMPGLQQLVETAHTLWQLYQQTGRRVVIALEPEPYCYPETTRELLKVFDILYHDIGPTVLQRHGVTRSDTTEILQKHIGVCFDTAHQAVEFEDLTVSLRSLLDAHIPIAKVQLSAALEVDPTAVSPAALARFADRTYLHQTYLQMPDGSIERYVDLPEGKGDWLHLPERPAGCAAQTVPVPFSRPQAESESSPLFPHPENSEKEDPSNDEKSQAREKKPETEQKGTGTFCRSEGQSQSASSLDKRSQSPFALRIHYHWPLYQPAAEEGIASTSHLLCGDFAKLLRAGGCPHWEIETYTWNILPTTTAQPLDLRDGIAQEFAWVLENLLD